MKTCGAVRSRLGLFLGVRKGFLQNVTYDLVPKSWVDANLEK